MAKRVDPVSFFIPVRGAVVEVTMEPWIRDDSATARFRARAGGKDLSDDTLEGLRTKLMTATRSAGIKVKVPFAMLTPVRSGYSHDGKWAIRTGVITGIHGGTGNLLARWDDTGTKEQLEGGSRYGSRAGQSGLLRPMDAQEAQRLIELQEKSDQLTRALAELKGRLALDAATAVQQEIDRQLDMGPGDPDGVEEPNREAEEGEPI